MKKSKILIGLFAIMWCGQSWAQTLMTLRCYFDNDTNPMQTISLDGQMSVDAPFEVDVSGLNKGIHTLYIEVLNFDGQWSHYATKQVQIIGSLDMATLNLVEYYFDDEGADGSGITVAVDAESIDQTFDISVEGLSNGTHILFVRVRDAGGAWSIPSHRLIQVVGSSFEDIVQAEYFWNNDPGFGNGNSLPLDAFLVDQAFDLSAEGLANGVHILFIRVKNAKGQWSLSTQHVVQVGSQGNALADVVLGEYFVDVDPGEGQGEPIAMGPSYLIDDQFDLTMPGNLTPGSHWLYVRVKNEYGYWSQAVGQLINVCSITIPTVAITGNDCIGGTATLTAPVGYNTYSWSTGQTINSINVTASGTYYLTVTDSDCETTVPVDVVFENSTPPTLTVTGTSCPGDPQTISLDDVYDTYSWSTGATSPTLTVYTAGTYDVTVNAGSCPSSASIEISYTLVPEIQTSISGVSCTGGSQIIQVVNPVYDSYQWLNGPSTPSFEVSATGNYLLNATYNGCLVSENVVVTFTDLPSPVISILGNPCEDSSLELSVPSGYSAYAWNTGSLMNTTTVNSSGNYFVVVNDGPCQSTGLIEVVFGSLVVEPLTVTGTGCPGSMFTLIGENGYDSYSWSPGGNTTSFLNTFTPGEYTLTVTEGECEGSVSMTVDYITVPELNIVSSGDLCPGGLITLDAGPIFDGYVWSPGGATTSFLNVTSSGTYSVQVNYVECILNESVTVDFIEMPMPTIGQTLNLLTCNEGGYTYQWYLNDEIIEGATNQFYSATVSGNYTVSITGNGCTSFSNSYFFQYTLVENTESNKLVLYPNPARTLLNVQGAVSSFDRFEVFDVTGRLVLKSRTSNIIDLNALSNGTYMIQFSSSAATEIHRFEKTE